MFFQKYPLSKNKLVFYICDFFCFFGSCYLVFVFGWIVKGKYSLDSCAKNSCALIERLKNYKSLIWTHTYFSTHLLWLLMFDHDLLSTTLMHESSLYYESDRILFPSYLHQVQAWPFNPRRTSRTLII